ncbi:MAG TPA: hypothetical protein IAC71_01235 [Candidatus Caccomonas pullistercoris]|nr:hypothetical protein [Candidatus Caccomonas pullistercoris]
MFKLIFLSVNDVRFSAAWVLSESEDGLHATAAKLLIYIITAKESARFLHSCACGEQAWGDALCGEAKGRM